MTVRRRAARHRNRVIDASVCIIGAGPAGLMAAIAAARANATVRVVERNPEAGRKLLLTGGGRCNVTHAGRPDEIARAMGSKGRFLRHALHEFPPQAVMQFFAERHLSGQAQPDGCVFPLAGGARDVRGVLVREAERLGVQFVLGSAAHRVKRTERHFLVHTGMERVRTDRLILATGGASWPRTGSTGDGYRFAGRLGHVVVPPRPALVPLVTRQRWVGELAGVALARVALRASLSGRRITADGALVFTQDGIGGPAALDLSRSLADALPAEPEGIDVRIDVAPATDEGKLDLQFRQHITAHARRAVAGVVAEFVPRRLASTLCSLADIDPALRCSQLSKSGRRRLAGLIKSLPLTVTSARSLAEATVTRGGVSTDQIDPRTMESKACPGLFFAGEIVDVDGPCGGYNLQICWSTGALAGASAARSLNRPDRTTPHAA